ncbi:hypothetical protein LBMAG56_52790 [Verrucomicrobiota bacterium]|nr:hypothetical protein LBMAG56_52790 [Verrucomicrobiota bacterium]
MNFLNPILTPVAILLAAFVAAFLGAAVNPLSTWLHAQIDFLPAVMVFAALTAGITTVTVTACLGGLWQDSLSANPLGISILPLFLVGLIVHRSHELILRDQPFAQFAVGLGASALAPFLTVLLLYTMGRQPIVGWGSLWQWLVVSLIGAVATPLIFWAMGGLTASLTHPVFHESKHRPDRSVRRGRL